MYYIFRGTFNAFLFQFSIFFIHNMTTRCPFFAGQRSADNHLVESMSGAFLMGATYHPRAAVSFATAHPPSTSPPMLTHPARKGRRRLMHNRHMCVNGWKIHFHNRVSLVLSLMLPGFISPFRGRDLGGDYEQAKNTAAHGNFQYATRQPLSGPNWIFELKRTPPCVLAICTRRADDKF